MMKLYALLFCMVATAVLAQGIDPHLAVDDRTVGGDPMKRYFLIRHRLEPSAEPKEYGLLLILPGGPGGPAFLPFCANVLTLAGVPKDFVVAELVAPVWDKDDGLGAVWSGRVFPSVRAKFTSEEFVDAVIDDVSGRVPVRPGRVFTLGWSSSGHVLYSSSIENPKIRGSFIAMSRSYLALLPPGEKARGKRYYFWHSPDDAICPYAEAEAAAALLAEHGASTVLRSYKGGHGWVPFTFYADRVREALEWFSADDANADALKTKIMAPAPVPARQ